MTDSPCKTALYQTHVGLGAKMVPFAGYEMPIQYKEGIIAEHEWTRSKCGLFDVSHMGQAILKGPGAAALLGKLTPSSFEKTPLGRAKYTVLANEKGGIIDDLIVTRLGEESFFLVLNAARKAVDVSWISRHLEVPNVLEEFTDRALIAVQGPKAEDVLQALVKDDVRDQGYMTARRVTLKSGEVVLVSRLGYTGEDGFEISLPGSSAPAFWQELLKNPDAKSIGLGARDSLRLEMGYPLYGHDLTEETSPVEANLSWVITKNHTGYVGEARIAKELANGVKRLRVGVKLTEKGIARENSPILAEDGKVAGILTSGGFSPSLKTAIGQGYVDAAYVTEGTKLAVEVRGRSLTAEAHRINFMEPRTKTMQKMKAAV